MTARPEEVEVATGYAPSSVGPYFWHEYPAAQVERDLEAIAHARIRTVRVMLSWDAFMPTDRQVSPRRMRELESLLTAARSRAMRVIPVLFVQSLGDCVMLPAWAVDARAPRRGVRVLTDGRVARGGPRDVWADPLMHEAEVRWLDALLAAFAGHPAIAAWDLGHDPAATVRPRRIAHVTSWLELLAPRIREQGGVCRMTLGQDDIALARAMRPQLIAAHVDWVGVAVRQHTLRLRGDVADPERVAFIAWLTRRFAGGDRPLSVALTVPAASAADDGGTVDGVFGDTPATRRAVQGALQRLVETGVTGVEAASWCDPGPRARSAPPCDTDAAIGYAGIVDSAGVSKQATAAWEELAAAAPATQAVVDAPPIDVEDWYRNLPESLEETYASWRGGQREADGIL